MSDTKPFSRRLALTVVVAAALIAPAAVTAGSANAHPRSSERGNAVLMWNAHAADAAIASCLAPTNNPLHESRMYAMMHIAIHDSLNAIKHRSRAYAYHGNAPEASPNAAVAAAARTTLVAALGALPEPFSGCAPAAVASVEDSYTSALGAIPNGRAKARGVALGERAASAILAKRADDGSDTPLFDAAYPQGDEPGEYRFTSTELPFAFAPKWGELDTFALRSAGQFRSDLPYELGSRKYARDLNEVKALGGDGVTTPSARTADQTEIALFWVESSPLRWNRVARTVAVKEELDQWESARLFGLLNMGLADGYVATFEQKYDMNFWRPVTAIREAGNDGNRRTSPDPTWTPLVITPPIPDHDSGHSVEGAAAAAVFRGFFGSDQMRFSVCSYTLPAGETCTDASPTMRSFNRFSEASAENAESRVLVGFHFRHATTSGIEQGTGIGKYVVNSYLQPRD